jgi:hypothetical protein
MTQIGRSSPERLSWHIQELISGRIDILSFCQAFETIYNLETEKSELTPAERMAFEEIFKQVIWYSPYADEREKIPNYVGEESVLTVVKNAAAKLNIHRM